MENVNSVEQRFPVFGNRFSLAIILSLSLIFLNACFSAAQEIKYPNVSGAFYPAEAKALSEQIDSFLNKAIVPTIDADIIALISPHAGYVYSGAVAAFGYKAIQGKNYKTVIVLAPSHYYGFKGISVWPSGRFRTPLSDMEVDTTLTSQIIKSLDFAKFVPEAFAKEHSLEVQLPFLQKTLGQVKIVPIVMGTVNLIDIETLAGVLKDLIGQRKDVLLIASTDLSHYHPYEEANMIDKETISSLEELDFRSLWDKELEGKAELCGIYPVQTVLAYAKKRNGELKILKHANSGDVTGDLSSVVGYASAAIYLKKDKTEGEKMLSIEQKKKLLKIARESMESYVKTGKRASFSVDDPELKRNQGAFVTLNEHSELRGCIGRIVSDAPLYQVVSDMAVEAASDDPRFPPVTAQELKDIEMEISALTPLEQISDVNKIEVGKHGIIIRQGFYSGLLLPQVATEYGWDRETFLNHTCMKAGLSQDCWKEKSSQIYIFSAEVFSEKSVK